MSTASCFFSDGLTFYDSSGTDLLPIGHNLDIDVWPKMWVLGKDGNPLKRKMRSIKKTIHTISYPGLSLTELKIDESKYFPPFSQPPSYMSLRACSSEKNTVMKQVPLFFTYYQWMTNFYPLQSTPVDPDNPSTLSNLTPASFLFSQGNSSQSYPIVIYDWVLFDSTQPTNTDVQFSDQYRIRELGLDPVDNDLSSYYYPQIKWILGNWRHVFTEDTSFKKFTGRFIPSPQFPHWFNGRSVMTVKKILDLSKQNAYNIKKIGETNYNGCTKYVYMLSNPSMSVSPGIPQC